MHNAEFYSGILAELQKAGAVTPPAQPAAPAAKPAAPAPAPKPQNVQFNPAVTKHLGPSLIANYGNLPIKEVPGRIQQDAQGMNLNYLKGRLSNNISPNDGMFSTTLNVAKNSYGLLKDEIRNPLARTGLSYLWNNKTRPVEALKELYDTGTTVQNLSTLPPEQQYHQVFEQTKTDPALKNVYDYFTDKGITETKNNLNSFSDIYNLATGEKNPYVSQAFKEDPNFRQKAIGAITGRAGTLAGEWLQNNWGKLALTVGGTGAAVMLLKNLMSGDDEEQQPQQPQQNPNAPRFL